MATKQAKPLRKEPALHYIEGTIDAIDIFNGKLRFSLLPSSGHFMSRDDGDKKALFINSDSSNATIVDPEKNVSGKEVVWFSIGDDLRDVLLTAKNNRNTIRVWCAEPEKTERATNEPTPPCVTRKVEGLRVF